MYLIHKYEVGSVLRQPLLFSLGEKKKGVGMLFAIKHLNLHEENKKPL
jgi:hypothetical protein